MHRNTLNFQYMAERTHYLHTKLSQDKETFFALDKHGFLTSWSLRNGEFLNKTRIEDIDVTGYDVDREVYDRDWFDGPILIQKKNQNADMAPSMISTIQKSFKVLDISEKGLVNALMEFEH